MCECGQHGYKDHYVCFACRKMFRQPSQRKTRPAFGSDKSPAFACPQCGTNMSNMGKDFKPPRQSNVKQWRKVQALYKGGFRFGFWQCGGSGRAPAQLREVKAFFTEQSRLSAAHEMQTRIDRRAAELSERREH